MTDKPAEAKKPARRGGSHPPRGQRVRHRDQAALYGGGCRRHRRRRLEPRRRGAIHPRHPSADVSAPAVHHAAIYRLRQRRRHQQALQISDRQRPDRAQRRVRSGDAMRLRCSASWWPPWPGSRSGWPRGPAALAQRGAHAGHRRPAGHPRPDDRPDPDRHGGVGGGEHRDRISVAFTPGFARVVEASVRKLRSVEYVQAARVFGATSARTWSAACRPT